MKPTPYPPTHRSSVINIAAKAPALVLAAAPQGGDLWEHVSPATLEAITRLVEWDMADDADIARRLGQRRNES